MNLQNEGTKEETKDTEEWEVGAVQGSSIWSLAGTRTVGLRWVAILVGGGGISVTSAGGVGWESGGVVWSGGSPVVGRNASTLAFTPSSVLLVVTTGWACSDTVVGSVDGALVGNWEALALGLAVDIAWTACRHAGESAGIGWVNGDRWGGSWRGGDGVGFRGLWGSGDQGGHTEGDNGSGELHFE